MNYKTFFKKLENVIELIKFNSKLYDIFTAEELVILDKSLYVILWSKKLTSEADNYMSETWSNDIQIIRNSIGDNNRYYYNTMERFFNDNGNVENNIVDMFLAKFKDVKLNFEITIVDNGNKTSLTTFEVDDKKVNTSLSFIGVNFGYLFGHTTEDNIGPLIYDFVRTKLQEINIFGDLQQIIDDKNK